MMTSSHHMRESGTSTHSVAYIQAQDTFWVTPLREYFERNGCRVVVNQTFAETPTYVIGAGDAAFVKHFIDSEKWPTAKKLAVIYEGDENALSGKRYVKVKQYYLDPSRLTEERAKEICAFFFTGTESFKNVRKEPQRARIASAIPKEALREPQPLKEQADLDARRIDYEMGELFQSKNIARQHRHIPKTRKWIMWSAIAIFATTITIALYVLSLIAGTGLLILSTRTLGNSDIRWTRSLITYSGAYRSLARGVLTLGSPLFLFLGQERVIEDQDRLLSILSDVASAEASVVTVFQKSKTVAGGVLNPYGITQSVGVADVMELSVEVSRVAQYLGLVTGQLESLAQARRFPFTIPFVSRMATGALVKLANVRTTVGYTEKLLTLYPHVAGFRKKQTYLVLLQNSMELRPTGGFIGSLILLSFVDGKVESLEIRDVYTADGQLKGHVDPPRPIREIVGSEHWYLRDSNWDPDFVVSGERARWFYEKETNQPIDGVIALSLPLVTRLLAVTGPIELLDFNDRISESNFFAKSLHYTEEGFFPGSTKKKDFLGSLTQSLLTRLTSDRNVSSGLLLAAFRQGIETRDIQFYFTDPELERLVAQWGWHGGVGMNQCQSVFSGECVGDGIAIVEANLGVNKVNFFVTREAISDVSLQENGDVEHTFTLRMQNTATPSEGGDWSYVNYLRFFLPISTIPESVFLDGNAVLLRDNTTSSPPSAPYWFHESVSGSESIHVVLIVPPGTTRQLTLRWIRRSGLTQAGRMTYQLTYRKQPGVTSIPWRTFIQYPSSWGVVREGGVAKPGPFEYTTDLAKDSVIRILFQKDQ